MSSYTSYGWRGRIGLILGAANVVTEPEFYMLAPDGVSAHAVRLTEPPLTPLKTFEPSMSEIEGAARALALAEVDIVVYLPPQGSAISNSPEVTRRVSELTGALTITAGEALVEALGELETPNIALASPHVDFVTRQERSFFEKNGFRVVSIKSLELATEGERINLGSLPPEAAYRLAKEADRDDADAVVITGTTLATADVIEVLEGDLGKPVVTSNQACLWLVLRRLNIAEPIDGYGRLLSEF